MGEWKKLHLDVVCQYGLTSHMKCLSSRLGDKSSAEPQLASLSPCDNVVTLQCHWERSTGWQGVTWNKSNPNQPQLNKKQSVYLILMSRVQPTQSNQCLTWNICFYPKPGCWGGYFWHGCLGEQQAEKRSAWDRRDKRDARAERGCV